MRWFRRRFTVRIYKDGDQTGAKWCDPPKKGELAFIDGRTGARKCCCNCRFRVRIVGHPWVTGGSISERVAWGCEGMRNEMACCDNDPDGAIFLCHEHGMCELWAAALPKRSAEKETR
jgi:hypothetical protein